MPQLNPIIQVFEFGWLQVDFCYGENKVKFSEKHFLLLQKYITQNSKSGYFQVFYNRIRFLNYVGIIRVGDLTIEILPKTEKHSENKKLWQSVLVEMLVLSLQVKVNVSTNASLKLRQMTVLESYLHLFLSEVESLIREGLIKKYRRIKGNENALKGKLVFQDHVAKNLIHAERFFVEHQVYDKDNLYNRILYKTLQCIQTLQVSSSISRVAERLLLDFPDCSPIQIDSKFFDKINYGRKSQRYHSAISLSKIILLNYHPDIRSGGENVLAIMFDMNHLWETFILMILKKANVENGGLFNIKGQNRKSFWKHPDNWEFGLKPDIVLENTITNEVVILDTKWKYQKETNIQDVRQMYAYGHYFSAKRRYLLFPDNLKGHSLRMNNGYFFDRSSNTVYENEICGLLFVDLLNVDGSLNRNIGDKILEGVFDQK